MISAYLVDEQYIKDSEVLEDISIDKIECCFG